MTKDKRVRLVSQHTDMLICPLCGQSMTVLASKSLICKKNHTFDFAKQGYVNMLTRSVTSQYTKALFESRHRIVRASKLYLDLHEKIATVINEYLQRAHGELSLFDAGCGEGSHLHELIKQCKDHSFTGVGLDISKEGIKLAASNYKTSIWLVGDLANLPLADDSQHVILNMLSPANYQEFKRVLAKVGLIIKVVPQANYLKELREVLFKDTANSIYTNDQTVTLFKQHFDLVDTLNLSYTKRLTETELNDLVQMTPMAWNADKQSITKFIKQDLFEVTVDLDILVGKK